MTCCCCTVWILVFAGLYALVKIYNKLTTGVYKGNERLDGKTVIVTGANSGIGLVCAKDFAKRGAKVILACRSMDTAEKAKREIIEETKNSQIKLKHVDFTSFASVRKCANEILSEESKIDILLNNAGIGRGNMKKTEDGLNHIMQANYFGPFLFTNILLGKIKQSSPSRIVNVASIAHRLSDLDLKYLKEGGTDGTKIQQKVYGNSKLGNIYFTNYLAKQLKGTGVTVNCLHPGTFGSEIARNTPYIVQILWKFFTSTFFKTIEEAAQTSIYLCVSPEVENITGEYFADCEIGTTTKISKDMGIARKLWEMTEEIVDLKESEKHYL